MFSSEGAGKKKKHANHFLLYIQLEQELRFSSHSYINEILSIKPTQLQKYNAYFNECMYEQGTVATILKLFTSGIWSALVYFAPEN